jgi:hypothetical protein
VSELRAIRAISFWRQSMRTLIAGLVLVTATVAAPAYADQITHKRARITIDVPENWKSSTSGDLIQLSDQNDEVAITFVAVETGSKKAAARIAKAELKKKIRNLTFTDPSDVTINGMPGVAFGGDGYLGDTNIDILLLALDTPSDEKDLLVIAIGADEKIAAHKREVTWVFEHLRPRR